MRDMSTRIALLHVGIWTTLASPTYPNQHKTLETSIAYPKSATVVRRRNVNPQRCFPHEKLNCALCCISVVIGNVGFDRLLGPGCGRGTKRQVYLCTYCMMGMITRLDMHEAGIPSWD